VTKIKIPYYVVAKGRGYWRPHPRMRRFSFSLIRCGKDGPAAWAIAESWNQKWQSVRKGEEPPPVDVSKLSRVRPTWRAWVFDHPRASRARKSVFASRCARNDRHDEEACGEGGVSRPARIPDRGDVTPAEFALKDIETAVHVSRRTIQSAWSVAKSSHA
jgi:hypothetical protein